MPRTRMDLTEGPIFKKLILFSLPILAGAVVTELYNVADSVIVGQFIGAQALAAVSASSPSNSIINMFLVGLETGASVVVAQKIGARSRQSDQSVGSNLQGALDTIALLTLLSGLLIMAAGVPAARGLLKMLHTPEEIFRDARMYMTVIFIGAAGNLVYKVGNGVLRGMGDSTWPFLLLCFCAGLNVLLDLLAVRVLHMGVAGAAIATSLSQFLSAVGVVWRINRSAGGAGLRLRGARIIGKEAGMLANVALPAALQNIGNMLAALFMQSYVNFFGASFAAANTIVDKIDNFSYIPIMAVSTAVCTFAAQNIGSNKLRRVYKGITVAILSLCSLGVLLTVLLLLTHNILPRLFTQDKQVVAIAARGITIMCYVTIFNGIDRVLLNAMRAAGRSVVPMITAQFGCFTRIVFGYFLAVRTGNSDGIFYSLLLAAFARMAAIAVYYYGFKGKEAIAQFNSKYNHNIKEKTA